MSARQEFFQWLDEWALLSELEGEAITCGAWPKVEKCQAAKKTLREKIDGVKALLNREEGPASSASPVRREIDRVVANLVALEQRNQERLIKRRALMQAEREGLETSGRRLRQIHRAFSTGERSVWQSYS